MKFIKTNLFDIYLTLIWLVVGIYSVVSNSITRFSYGTLLCMFIIAEISNMFFRYECYKLTGRKKDK